MSELISKYVPRGGRRGQGMYGIVVHIVTGVLQGVRDDGGSCMDCL